MYREQYLAVEKELNFLKSVHDTVPGGIVQYRMVPPHEVLYYDRRIMELIGYEDREEFAKVAKEGLLQFVHNEDYDYVVKLTKKVMENGGKEEFVNRIRKKDESISWLGGTISLGFDLQGEEVLQIYYIDITRQKEEEILLEQQYNEEIAYREVVSPDLIASFRVNISRNAIEEISAQLILNGELSSRDTGNELMEKLAIGIVDEDKKKQYFSLLSIENLIKVSEEGKNQVAIEYQYRLIENTVIWVSHVVNIKKRPSTGDLIAFGYIRDITDKKLSKGVLDSIVESDYDFMSHVDGINDICTIISKAHGLTEDISLGRIMDFRETNIKYIKKHVVREDIEYCIREMEMDKVCYELDRYGKHAFIVRFKGDNGKENRKKMQYSYIDKANKIVRLSRQDITDIYEETYRRNEILKDALLVAEEASNAKSKFLSRISHDIRTPLNAIIGMATIATVKIEDKERVRDCLDKIAVSSQYLLSLVNDVLDMSRIESGKMNLSTNKFDLEELIKGTTSIMMPQANEKSIEYCVYLDENMNKYYKGDALRFNQILMNLLSNSLKYTNSGGKITINISEKKRYLDIVDIEVVVKDNGIGMSEEFQEKMFEPFEQESEDNARNNFSSGLGLTIVSNMVKLMEGSMSVESKVNEGTTFSVIVKLGLNEEEVDYKKDIHTGSLSDCYALLIDNDPISCQQTNILLDRIGVYSEWFTTGEEALEVILSKKNKSRMFDIIIVDAKVTDLDGISTVEKIRKMLAEYDVTIIMTAYDWSDIEELARDAGVDYFLGKPLFQTSIYETLLRIKSPHNTTVVENNKKRFNGQRMLLVEDNLINLEIAKTLLEFENLTVETAENGKEAVEKFVQVPVGYYSGILMDIRMPIMNGFEATKAIRNLKREDAKLIPIIALSANAFQEEMIEARRAGIDGYLIKPIEVEKMYRLLEKVIYHVRF